MTKKEEKKISFVSFIVEFYKRENRLTGKQTSEIFEKHNICEWLFEHYDVLHSMSSTYVLHEINDIIEKHAEQQN